MTQHCATSEQAAASPQMGGRVGGAGANGAFTVEQYDRNEELLWRLHRIEGARALGNGEGRTG